MPSARAFSASAAVARPDDEPVRQSRSRERLEMRVALHARAENRVGAARPARERVRRDDGDCRRSRAGERFRLHPRSRLTGLRIEQHDDRAMRRQAARCIARHGDDELRSERRLLAAGPCGHRTEPDAERRRERSTHRPAAVAGRRGKQRPPHQSDEIDVAQATLDRGLVEADHRTTRMRMRRAATSYASSCGASERMNTVRAGSSSANTARQASRPR
jgi:hypothetical protein